MMSLETRSTSALLKRAEQLKRWQESDTFRQPSEPKNKSRKIQFTDGCIFLAACAAGDREEVEELLKRGADIDTANVDGLTALHQACIDDNLEMVEFLVARGADVNRGDNEGWTPLHATASCGFLSIARYLLDQDASVSAVNNDGELAIDISESDEMEELLQKSIDARGVDCEASRHSEERLMLEDARRWLKSSDAFKEVAVAHSKTGATPLHVACAKGYIKVVHTLLQCGADLNAQDFDGWTPLHAAAHWAQKEACDLLCENDQCNMDIKNQVGQTVFDVADPEFLEHLSDLKKKMSNMQKDKPTPEVKSPSIRSVPSSFAVPGNIKRRSSITRLSLDDKLQRYKDASSHERDILNKAVLPETIHEKPYVTGDVPNTKTGTDSSRSLTHDADVFGDRHLLPHRDDKIPAYTPPQFEDKEKILNHSTQDGDLLQVHPWRRPASLRVRPTNMAITDSLPASSSMSTGVGDGTNLRRNHSFDDRKRQPADCEVKTGNSPSVRNKEIQISNTTQVRRSFVPPVRDEESETQRKAHAKRVRETRRSTQGVTLEDLKSAEQLVRKKQQQENKQRTSELQQLVATQHHKQTAVTTDHSGNIGQDWNACGEESKSVQSDPKQKSLHKDVKPTSMFSSLSGIQSPKPTEDSLHTGFMKDRRQESPTASRHCVTRKKKPKRRSTGVVQFDELDQAVGGESDDSVEGSLSDLKIDDKRNGAIDYKKLWEECQRSNDRLKEDLSKVREDLIQSKKKWEAAMQTAVSSGGMSDAERNEKKTLERKLSEMEEELKQLEHLKSDNQRLRDENGALIRVISKLSK